MRVLELFAGTGSVGEVFREFGHSVYSLDIDPKSPCTVHADILQWDYSALGSFDLVWASPPCTEYSCARTTAKTPRDLLGADALVRRAFQIIAHFRPRWWFVENPLTGLLKSRAIVRGFPFVDLAYCSYGAPYRKLTRIWTNLEWQPRGCAGNACPAVTDGRHALRVSFSCGVKCGQSHRIPRALVLEILSLVSPQVAGGVEPQAGLGVVPGGEPQAVVHLVPGDA